MSADPARDDASRRRAAWLPTGPAGPRYAVQHGFGLPLPQKLKRLLASYLTWFLRFARLPSRVSRDAAALPSPTPDGWPLVIFSHGLWGCAASYSGLCGELASHGAVVVAMEHKDGSAVYSETDDGEALPFTPPAKDASGDDSAGRERQQRQRVAEVRALLDGMDEVAARALRHAKVDRRRVALVGHSFGASTALRVATELGACVKAVVASDPWISGYDVGTHGAAAVPTLALTTQSMMYPANEARVGATLRGVGCDGHAPALYAEAVRTRHQEISDYPCLSYAPLRFFCMAGGRKPTEAHTVQARLIVGFLALSGVLEPSRTPSQPPGQSAVSKGFSGELCDAREAAQRLLLQPDENHKAATESAQSLQLNQYLVHGATAPSAYVEAVARQAQRPADRRAANPTDTAKEARSELL